eukprot:NODE_32_length_32166_cov_0.707737.p10 type:complete len:205 gc:universal NODE_32_length_32166_cov_0.707737:15760-15146(-)
MSSEILDSPIENHFKEMESITNNMSPENLADTKPMLKHSHSNLKMDLEHQQLKHNEVEAKFRARQIIYACNEKLLRALVPKLNITEAEFWRTYSFNNLHQVLKSKKPEIQRAWTQVCAELGIKRDFGTEYKYLSKDLNVFIHSDSFKQVFNMEELKSEADTVFGTDSVAKKDKRDRYLEYLEVANKVAEKYKAGLYEYDIFATD